MTEEEAELSSLDETLAEAARLAEEGLAESALELLLVLERDHPDEAMVLYTIGVVSRDTEAAGASYDYFRRALGTQPEDPYLLALLGTELARYDDPDAEGVLRLAALTAPHLGIARLSYGSYLAREGMTDLAISELQAAEQLEPGSVDVRRELGIAHLIAGSPGPALDALESAIEVAGDPELRVLKALAFLGENRLEEAAEELHAVSLALPDDGDLQLAAALSSASQDWMDEAWSAIARAQDAGIPPDSDLLREVEDLIEAGPEASGEFLTTQLGPAILRDRVLSGE